MLKTITVRCGTTQMDKAAEDYALDLAERFGARLKGVTIWSTDDVHENLPPHADAAPDQVGHQDLTDLATRAEERKIAFIEGSRGEGVEQGLLAESQLSDLLVLPLPSELSGDLTESEQTMIEEDLPLLREAECSVLAVTQAPTTIQRLLCVYQGGMDGKAALRMTGHLAERYACAVDLLPMTREREQGTILGAAAMQYLEAFDIRDIHEMKWLGGLESKIDIMKTASEREDNLVVMGVEPYGLVEHIFGRTTAADFALSTRLPVVLAR